MTVGEGIEGLVMAADVHDAVRMWWGVMTGVGLDGLPERSTVVVYPMGAEAARRLGMWQAEVVMATSAHTLRRLEVQPAQDTANRGGE